MAEEEHKSKVAKILGIKAQLESDGGTRHTHYDEILEATHGRYYDRYVNETWQKWQGIVYEPSPSDSDRRQVHIVVNLLNPIVEAKRALWSVVPEIRVPYKSLDDADMRMTDTLERVYRALWHENRIGEKLGDGGWYAALLGTAVMMVYPDFEKKRPRLVARSPYGFYGVPKNLEQDGTEWSQVMFVTKMRRRQAARMWPGKGIPEDGDLCHVIEFMDEEEKFTVIEELELVVKGPVKNKVGSVPVVTIPNISQPGQWWGKGDVEDAIPVINELNKRFNVENQAFSDQAGAPWEAIEPDMDEKDISLDPDAINVFSAGGGLKKSSTGGLPWQIYQSNQQLRSYIDMVTDMPEVIRSMFGGSNISGKAINNMMGPIQARMELRQRYLYPRLEMMNQHMMQVWAAYWGEDTHVLHGSIKGRRYNLEIVPKDFEGYYENEVYLDSSAYFDVQSKVIIGLQMIAANGLSIKTFIQKMNPFVDDYTAEKEQIDKEQQERIQMAMTAQMMAQSPMGMNPDVGTPSSDQNAMMAGKETGPTPVEPPPGVNPNTLENGLFEAGMLPQRDRFFTEEQPQGQESPLTGALGQGGVATPLAAGGMDFLTHVADLIRSTPKVSGRIFLSGSILEGEKGPEGIEIWFTDMPDWATVRQHVTKRDPELKGMFNPQQGVPNIAFLEVTPGTEGYEPSEPGALAAEGLEAIPAGAMPEGGAGPTMAGAAGMPAAPPPPEMMGGM